MINFFLVPPAIPVISNAELIATNRVIVRGVQGNPLTLECISSGGYPLQTVNWYKDSVTSAPLNSESSHLTFAGQYNVTTRYSFKPGRTNDRQLYICQSSYFTEPSLLLQSNTELYLEWKFQTFLFCFLFVNSYPLFNFEETGRSIKVH